MPQLTNTIPLTQGHEVLVDEDDYEVLAKLKWHASANRNGNVYACRDVKIDGIKMRLKMHRVIMDAPSDLLVDHINHNSLDNRKSNLRICTKSENMRNRSGACRGASSSYLGVAWCAEGNCWQVGINVDGKRRALGRYNSEIEAAKVYDRAARKFFGAFASPNFPE